jgi:hypothetical protein
MDIESIILDFPNLKAITNQIASDWKKVYLIIITSDACAKCKQQLSVLSEMMKDRVMASRVSLYQASLIDPKTMEFAQVNMSIKIVPSMILIKVGQPKWIYGYRNLKPLREEILAQEKVCVNCLNRRRITFKGVRCKKQLMAFGDVCDQFR